MAPMHDVILRKLLQHSRLSDADINGLHALPHKAERVPPNQDIVRQGDKPKFSAIVMQGMLARYHNLPSGGRQYLSFHIAGDMPDVQSLFIETMDHAVCAIDYAAVALVPHESLLELFEERPNVGFAIWRETLIDAAIFRQAITNIGSRPTRQRLAHFLCEQYYLAHARGLTNDGLCRLPLTQLQMGEALGMSLPTTSRALQRLRRSRAIELRRGQLFMHDYDQLAALGEFNPAYLQLRKPALLKKTLEVD